MILAGSADELACTYGDTTKCTGKFKDRAGGSPIMIAVSKAFPLTIDADGFTPPFGYTWVGEGSLKSRHGR